jgi:hypothetical protein
LFVVLGNDGKGFLAAGLERDLPPWGHSARRSITGAPAGDGVKFGPDEHRYLRGRRPWLTASRLSRCYRYEWGQLSGWCFRSGANTEAAR